MLHKVERIMGWNGIGMFGLVPTETLVAIARGLRGRRRRFSARTQDADGGLFHQRVFISLRTINSLN